MRFYLRALYNQQTLLPFAVLFALGLAVVLVRRMRYQHLLLLGWIVLPYVLLSWFTNKDVRYNMPYLPAVAALTAIGLSALRPVWVRNVLATTLLLYGAFQYASLTWGLSARVPAGWLPLSVSVRLGSESMLLYSEAVHVATAARSEDWKIEDIIGDMHLRDCNSSLGAPAKLIAMPNAEHFESNVFDCYAAAEGWPLQVDFIASTLPITDTR